MRVHVCVHSCSWIRARNKECTNMYIYIYNYIPTKMYIPYIRTLSTNMCLTVHGLRTCVHKCSFKFLCHIFRD